VTCSVCGSASRPGHSFCVACGTEFPNEASRGAHDFTGQLDLQKLQHIRALSKRSARSASRALSIGILSGCFVVMCIFIGLLVVMFRHSSNLSSEVHSGRVSEKQDSTVSMENPNGPPITSVIQPSAEPAIPHYTLDHVLHFFPGDDDMRQQLAEVPSIQEVLAEPFEITYVDLRGDDKKEIVLQSQSPLFCGSGGCSTFVLDTLEGLHTPLLSENLGSELGITNEFIKGYKALAAVDGNAQIAIGDQAGTPLLGKQMIYPIKP
jgi:hypothetical protein